MTAPSTIEPDQRQRHATPLLWVIGVLVVAAIVVGTTADLDRVQVTGDRAEVWVVLRPPADVLPFEPAQPSREAFQLVRHADAWRITGAPWPVTWCEAPR